MNTLIELLQLRPGITSVIGSGGKTSLLAALGDTLKKRYKVILTTTTHIFPFAGMQTVSQEKEITEALARDGIVCVGSRSPEGKLVSPAIPFSRLRALADFVLVEADGSRRLPLKAHKAHEPVIPSESDQTICVVGLSAVGKTIVDCVHRPELFAELCGCGIQDTATVERIAAVLKKEKFYDRILLNQLDSVAQPDCAERLANLLDCPVIAGSLQKGSFLCLL